MNSEVKLGNMTQEKDLIDTRRNALVLFIEVTDAVFPEVKLGDFESGELYDMLRRIQPYSH